MNNPITATRAALGLVTFKNSILLIDRISKPQGIESHHWYLPGGRLNPHETPDAAIVREVFEETGIHCKVIKELGARPYPKNPTGLFLHYFECECVGNSELTIQIEEVKDAKWVPLNDALEWLGPEIFEPVKKCIEEKTKKTHF
jgi:8-oxo-dGTP diphosphatase